jgi:very-short-patch-repair endonuclease
MTRYTSHGRRWTQQRELARGMRREPTAAENLLWKMLRGRKLGRLKFRRQHPVERFILDFYCVELGLAIEVDGGVHDAKAEEDATRQAYLEDRGIQFLRFSNDEIMSGPATVLRRVSETATKRQQQLSPSPRRGEGAGG